MGCKCTITLKPIPIGQDIRDVYHIGKVLGSGAFGQVHECILQSTGKPYAVKIMERNSSEVGHWSNESMFRREVELLKYLDNPHIIDYVDFFEDSHFLYVVIELCSGGELFRQIVKCKHFDERDVAYLCHQMLTAIEYCHSLNIVHRDIKAENFLFKWKDSNADLKLIDFGMAAKLSVKYAYLTEVCGSPHYLAPELIGRHYGTPSDIWALGILIYLMIFGRYPFDGSTTEAIVKQIITKPIESEIHNLKISADAKDFLLKLLQRDPKLRIKASTAMQHSWIQKYKNPPEVDPMSNTPNEATENLIEYVRLAHRKLSQNRSVIPTKDTERQLQLLELLQKQWAHSRKSDHHSILPLNKSASLHKSMKQIRLKRRKPKVSNLKSHSTHFKKNRYSENLIAKHRFETRHAEWLESLDTSTNTTSKLNSPYLDKNVS